MVFAENANKGSQQPVVKTGFVAYVFGLPIFGAKRASLRLQICLRAVCNTTVSFYCESPTISEKDQILPVLPTFVSLGKCFLYFERQGIAQNINLTIVYVFCNSWQHCKILFLLRSLFFVFISEEDWRSFTKAQLAAAFSSLRRRGGILISLWNNVICTFLISASNTSSTNQIILGTQLTIQLRSKVFVVFDVRCQALRILRAAAISRTNFRGSNVIEADKLRSLAIVPHFLQ